MKHTICSRKAKIWSLLFMSAVVTTAVAACHTMHQPSPVKVYRGVVLKNVCSCIAVQFTDGTNMGQVGWVDAFDSTRVYDHVFAVANFCTWGGASAADTINFYFSNPEAQNCVACLVYSPTPDTSYYIRVVH